MAVRQQLDIDFESRQRNEEGGVKCGRGDLRKHRVSLNGPCEYRPLLTHEYPDEFCIASVLQPELCPRSAQTFEDKQRVVRQQQIQIEAATFSESSF